jgi:glycosyltransferase
VKFSVITICRNAENTIGPAVQSVVSQSFSQVEYLIIDGASTDGTLQKIAEVAGPDVQVISEPDRGLYDALNKGVRMATGDVIGFVHADDVLAHADVLAHVAEKFETSGADGVYGDLQYVTADGAVLRHWKSGACDRRKLKWGWMPPHPALYLKRSVYERAVLENGDCFDTSFRCAADYDFMMRVIVGHGVEPAYLPEVLVKMRIGGVSNRSLKHIAQKSLEDWRIIRRHRLGHLHTLAGKNLGKLHQFFIR